MRGWLAGVLGVGLLGAVGAGAMAAPPAYHVVQSIPGPDGGWDYVRVDAPHNRLLVTRGDSVMSVDLADSKVTSGLAPGSRLHLAMPLRGGAEFVVTNGGDNSVVFADARTGTALLKLPVAKGPDDAVFDPRSGLILVVGHAGGEVTLVDPKTHAVAGSIPVGGTLEAAAVDGVGLAFVNVEDRNEIAVLDVAGRKVLGRYELPGCEGPTGLAYDRHDMFLLAACDGATDVVHAATGELVATLPTGHGADGVVYDAVRRLAFVPAGRDGTLSVIAFADGKPSVVQTVPTQRGARTLAVDERTGRLYLPTATYVAASGGGRPTVTPGSFKVLVVAP